MILKQFTLLNTNWNKLQFYREVGRMFKEYEKPYIHIFLVLFTIRYSMLKVKFCVMV